MGLSLEVTKSWRGALLSLSHFRDPTSLIIGNEKKAQINIDDRTVPNGCFGLISKHGDSIFINNASFITLLKNGTEVKASQVELGKKDEVIVKVGSVELGLRWVSTTKPVPVPFFDGFDYRYALLILLLLVMQAGILIQFQLMPATEKEPDLMKNPEEFREVVVKMKKREIKKQLQASSTGAKAPGDEGLIGKKDKPIKDMLPSPKGNKLATENTPVRSEQAALNMLKKLGLRKAGSVVGSGGVGHSSSKGLLGLRGSEVGIAGGHGGLGTKGTGYGGGGTKAGAMGLGSGSGVGLGGTGDVDLGGKGKGRTRIIPGKILYEGGLTRAEIQRVVELSLIHI